jgi:hypothetical protein
VGEELADTASHLCTRFNLLPVLLVSTSVLSSSYADLYPVQTSAGVPPILI